jgi:hypothetical protein
MGKTTTPPCTWSISASVMAASLAAKSTVRLIRLRTPAPLPTDW